MMLNDKNWNPYEIPETPFRFEKFNPRKKGTQDKKKAEEFANRSASIKRKVLIVEDEALIAQNLKEMLEDEGFTVSAVVSSGEEAIRQFRSIDPDLVLMDVRLSGSIDGIQTAIAIHNTIKQVPIMFLTAFGEDQFPHLNSVTPPLYTYVRKPYTAGQILERVRELLTRFDSEHE